MFTIPSIIGSVIGFSGIAMSSCAFFGALMRTCEEQCCGKAHFERPCIAVRAVAPDTMECEKGRSPLVVLRTTAAQGSAVAMQVISEKKVEKILSQYGPWIKTVSDRYGVPTAVIDAVLYQEATMINLLDVFADLAVLLRLPVKKNSSTGYMQIYGWVALNAANYAVEHGLATYESLGIVADHKLDPGNSQDVHVVWRLLYRNQKANIELATLNLVVAADEMLGRIDFNSMSDEDLMLVFSRYNGNVKSITSYGRRAFEKYREFCS